MHCCYCMRNLVTRYTPIGVVLHKPPAVNHLVVHIHFLVRELSEIGTTRAAKVVSSDSPPSICYIALQSSEYLKPPGCRERFSIFVGVCPQNWSLGGKSDTIGQPALDLLKPPWRSSEYLKPPACREHFSIFVGGLTPKLRFGGHLGGKSYTIGQPALDLLKPSRDHLNTSNRFRVIPLDHFVTDRHTHTHTRDSVALSTIFR